jgi:hypothetical protein
MIPRVAFEGELFDPRSELEGGGDTSTVKLPFFLTNTTILES